MASEEEIKQQVVAAQQGLLSALTQAALASAQLQVLRRDTDSSPEKISGAAIDFRNKERTAHEQFENLLTLQASVLLSAGEHAP